jgi:hypothetical protein
MPNAVTAVPAAPANAAAAHFAACFTFETDCWEVHEAIASGNPGFVLLDVRDPTLYAAGHIQGAISLPHAKIIAARLRAWPDDTLFVTYCAGPHCNGATRRAAAGPVGPESEPHGRWDNGLARRTIQFGNVTAGATNARSFRVPTGTLAQRF